MDRLEEFIKNKSEERHGKSKAASDILEKFMKNKLGIVCSADTIRQGLVYETDKQGYNVSGLLTEIRFAYSEEGPANSPFGQLGGIAGEINDSDTRGQIIDEYNSGLKDVQDFEKNKLAMHQDSKIQDALMLLISEGKEDEVKRYFELLSNWDKTLDALGRLDPSDEGMVTAEQAFIRASKELRDFEKSVLGIDVVSQIIKANNLKLKKEKVAYT